MANLRNASGAVDPVQYIVCKAEADDEKRVRQAVLAIKRFARALGFEFECRFVLKDKKTGKVWR